MWVLSFGGFGALGIANDGFADSPDTNDGDEDVEDDEDVDEQVDDDDDAMADGWWPTLLGFATTVRSLVTPM